jgi:hypothetical protein
MRQIAIIGFALVVTVSAIAQDTVTVPPQLTQVPPKPSCHWIFNTGPCNDLWRAYNQALAQRQREELQLYVNRQKELASSQAAAPLQQQIIDLNKQIADLTTLSTGQQEQIKSLQEQMQADSAAALQANSEAHKRGLEQGTGIGAGVVLLLFGVIFGMKKIGGSSQKTLARGATG